MPQLAGLPGRCKASLEHGIIDEEGVIGVRSMIGLLLVGLLLILLFGGLGVAVSPLFFILLVILLVMMFGGGSFYRRGR